MRTSSLRVLLLAAAAVVFLAAGCEVEITRRPTESPIGQEAQGPERRIPLEVVQGPGGSVLAFVQVAIDGRGPFRFALDTGASHSVLDRELRSRLQLPQVGQTAEVTGVASTSQAELVRVERWRLGDVDLEATTAVVLDLPETDRQVGLQGLLGSDMLSRFGSITVDYGQKHLTLRPGGTGTGQGAATDRREVALEVMAGPGGSVLAFVPIFIQDQGSFRFALDTGASSSVVDQDLVRRLALPTAGTSAEVTGVAATTRGQIVQIERWRMGEVPLPASRAVALDLPDADARVGMQGLLGSDMLSRFGVVTIDYEGRRLLLPPAR